MEIKRFINKQTKKYEKDINSNNYPNQEIIKQVLNEMKLVIFPDYFYDGSLLFKTWYSDIVNNCLGKLEVELKKVSDEDILDEFVDWIDELRDLLEKDANAGFEGDPAAKSVQEIVLTYLSYFAIFVYRIANFFYKKGVSLIPRIMSEYAHSITGIDIHPGATIGECFFIDHGTGVVIGETTIIGKNVKLYQGVTLGALSTKKGQGLSGVKRHPTIEDNCVIYSNASILGGKTIIGENSIIGGNAFITKSVLKNTIVKGIG